MSKTTTGNYIIKDFEEVYPNTAKLVVDYRPVGDYQIHIWLKTGREILYDYLTRDIVFLLNRDEN